MPSFQSPVKKNATNVVTENKVSDDDDDDDDDDETSSKTKTDKPKKPRVCWIFFF